jgi:hypothetical protein
LGAAKFEHLRKNGGLVFVTKKKATKQNAPTVDATGKLTANANPVNECGTVAGNAKQVAGQGTFSKARNGSHSCVLTLWK